MNLNNPCWWISTFSMALRADLKKKNKTEQKTYNLQEWKSI